MYKLLFVIAAMGLGACETLAPLNGTTSGTTTSSSSSSANSSGTTAGTTTAPPAPAAYRAPPDQQLLELERRLSAQAQTGGLGPAYASVIDPTEGFIVRAGQVYSSADEITRGLAPPAGAGPIYWQPDRVEVSTGGDMGMTSGRYVQVVTGQEAIQGRYTAVWRRIGGDWKLLTESRIADPPRTRAATTRRR